MNKNLSSRTVAVIGGGPAGLMAAERLAATGAVVTVYDHMPTLGRKFLMAGRGGLNLTHSEALAEFIKKYGAAADWLGPMVEAFPPEALRDWCHGLGIETFVGSSGRVFPTGLKASPLLRAWLRRLEGLGVRVALRHRWLGWGQAGELRFTNGLGAAVEVRPDAVVLALGGASWPRLGSDGGWAALLKERGVAVADLAAANCGFIAPWSEIFAGRFAGEPLKPVRLSFGARSLQGEAVVTREGLEGGAVYALAGDLRAAIAKEGKAVLSVDLRPGMSEAELRARLDKPRGSQSMATWLRKAVGLAPVAIGLMRESQGGGLPEDEGALAGLIKAVPVTLTATAGLARAISTAGGVRRDVVDEGLMLKALPGVFVCGEMLDWEAPTGGYLLQGCFSSAVATARGVEGFLGAGG